MGNLLSLIILSWYLYAGVLSLRFLFPLDAEKGRLKIKENAPNQ